MNSKEGEKPDKSWAHKIGSKKSRNTSKSRPIPCAPPFARPCLTVCWLLAVGGGWRVVRELKADSGEGAQCCREWRITWNPRIARRMPSVRSPEGTSIRSSATGAMAAMMRMAAARRSAASARADSASKREGGREKREREF